MPIRYVCRLRHVCRHPYISHLPTIRSTSPIRWSTIHTLVVAHTLLCHQGGSSLKVAYNHLYKGLQYILYTHPGLQELAKTRQKRQTEVRNRPKRGRKGPRNHIRFTRHHISERKSRGNIRSKSILPYVSERGQRGPRRHQHFHLY
jgi:hypothetical protein